MASNVNVEKKSIKPPTKLKVRERRVIKEKQHVISYALLVCHVRSR
jgi:hypothetical protein